MLRKNQGGMRQSNRLFIALVPNDYDNVFLFVALTTFVTLLVLKVECP